MFIIPRGNNLHYLSGNTVGTIYPVRFAYCYSSRSSPVQSLCAPPKLKKTPALSNCATTILFTESSFAEDFSVSTLQLATMRSSVPEPALTIARHFRLEVDIVLSHRASLQATAAVSSILQGAGLHQSSRHSWESASCDIEESTDLLSDVFLELQAMDDQIKECIETLQVSMCDSRNRAGVDAIAGAYAVLR